MIGPPEPPPPGGKPKVQPRLFDESAVFAAAGEYGFAPVVARFHNVYGPRMPATHVIPELLRRCLRREDPIAVLGPEQTRSFLYVDDAARGLALAPRSNCVLASSRLEALGIHLRPIDVALTDVMARYAAAKRAR